MKLLLSTLVLFSLSAFAADKKIAAYNYEDADFRSECALFATDEGLRVTHTVAYSGKEETQELPYVRDYYNFAAVSQELINAEYTTEQNSAGYQATYAAYSEGKMTPIFGTGKVSYHSKSDKTDYFIHTIDAVCSLFVDN